MRRADECERCIFGFAPLSSMIDIDDLPSHTAGENKRVLKITAVEFLQDQRAYRLDVGGAIWRETQSTKRDRL